MPASPLRLIKNATEFCDTSMIADVPRFTRGIYVLYNYNRNRDLYDVVYVGMAGGEKTGVKVRLRSHLRSKRNTWTHFSVFQVWDNIREEEIRELEGIFRHIYRYDARANKLNKQKSFKALNKLRANYFDDWV